MEVSSRERSTTPNSLTVSSMQQSRMKSLRIGHQRSKRKPTYILQLKTDLQRLQRALALMPPLEVHSAIKQQ